MGQMTRGMRAVEMDHALAIFVATIVAAIVFSQLLLGWLFYVPVKSNRRQLNLFAIVPCELMNGAPVVSYLLVSFWR
jgi:hypothetical protein